MSSPTDIPNKDSQKDLYIPHKIHKYPDQGPDDAIFYEHKRQVFVFTPAGKPIFSRYIGWLLDSIGLANVLY